MYRRPLQSAVRQLLNASASRAVLGKVIVQAACQSRAVVACRITADAWVPNLSQCRSLHVTRELCTVKETAQTTDEEVGTFTKLIEAMGFTGPLKYNKWKIKIAALRMYTCCVERINYDEFFEKCSLPDTLNSWFLVAQLHVWMCLVRMRQEGRAGKYMCRYIVHSMWEDVEQRSKIMGDVITMLYRLWRHFELSAVQRSSKRCLNLCKVSKDDMLLLRRVCAYMCVFERKPTQGALGELLSERVGTRLQPSCENKNLSLFPRTSLC
ncbi:hypothetical protein PO909_005278 [Leuciscus waleckii]